MEMQHFLHEHPLKPAVKSQVDGVLLICNGCKEALSGQVSYCNPCLFFLHKSCAEHPQQLQHFFHKCPLLLEISTTFICDACDKHGSDLAYHCQQCDFYMDVECAKLATVSSRDETQHIMHYCHYHPLKQRGMMMNDSEVSCQICGQLCSDSSYGCSDCKFYVHEECLKVLPREINYPFHGCALVLLTFAPHECVACEKSNARLTFRCSQCWFDVCVFCAMQFVKDREDHRHYSIYHRHLLTFDEKDDADGASCAMCEERCLGPTYDCSRCNMVFHESCANLPEEIRHPYHPQHRLILKDTTASDLERVKCNLCLKECRHEKKSERFSAYYCSNKCNFQLDIPCASLSLPKSLIKYEGHCHFLAIAENLHGEAICNNCADPCVQSDAVLRCLECINFNLHLLCGPLPCTINNKYHVHPLVLEDLYVQYKDLDKFACHVCENERDPRFCVYRCAEGCEMICEMDCVMSEVMSSLRGEQGSIKLRTVDTNITGELITTASVSEFKQVSRDNGARYKPFYFFTDMIDALCLLETDDIAGASDEMVDVGDEEDFCYDADRDYFDEAEGEGVSDDKDSDEKAEFSFSMEDFKKYMDDLDSANLSIRQVMLFISQQRYNRFVVTEDNYLLPQILAPVVIMFKELLTKHNVIDVNSKLSCKTKQHSVFILCAVLHSMNITKVVDVTARRIRQWLSCLKLVEQHKFKVESIIERVRSIAIARYFMKSRKLLDTTSHRLQEEVEDMTEKLERAKLELEELQKEKEQFNAYKKSALRSLWKEYKEAILIRWEPAIDDL